MRLGTHHLMFCTRCGCATYRLGAGGGSPANVGRCNMAVRLRTSLAVLRFASRIARQAFDVRPLVAHSHRLMPCSPLLVRPPRGGRCLPVSVFEDIGQGAPIRAWSEGRVAGHGLGM